MTCSQCADKTRIENVVVEYLKEKKKWERKEYRLEDKGTTGEGKLAKVWAIYLKDETEARPGTGQSVELHVDCAEYRVVKELAFQ